MEIKDRNLSAAFQFQRIAIHHVILPPMTRSSIPHAESLEEEFFYVLKGKPDLWVNGYIYPLDVGFAVGLVAGTGIAHTVLNNSSEEVELLVVGEKTLKENHYFYPLNPELKSQHLQSWWEDPPAKKMGPHDGLPHPILEADLGRIDLPFIYDCKKAGPQKLFHYPGDNETFGEGLRLTNVLNLKTLAIWLELLPPQRRSSYPHAHTHEEEFAFILSGEADVWLHGDVKKLKKNDSIGFAPNTGIAHCLINSTEQTMTYLSIGETREFLQEKIYYPLNPFRNLQCQRQKTLWENPLPLKLKGGLAHPPKSFPENIRLRLCQPADAPEVLKIFLSNVDSFLKMNGAKPTIKTALQYIIGVPPKPNFDFFKEFLIIEYLGKAIGVFDLYVHHPTAGTCFINLFIIDEKYQKSELPQKCLDLCEDYIRRSYKCTEIVRRN